MARLSLNELPAFCADDPEMLEWAQKRANETGEPVVFMHWHGEIVKTVEPEQ